MASGILSVSQLVVDVQPGHSCIGRQKLLDNCQEKELGKMPHVRFFIADVIVMPDMSRLPSYRESGHII